MKPTIQRSKFSNAYVVENVRLLIVKSKSDKPVHIVTFFVGDLTNSVLIDRKEAVYTLRNFKKVIDKSRKNA